jgi:hypothetical protein
MDNDPVPPELDVPELKTNKPEVPVEPAFAERILIAPLVLAAPSPALTYK